jgi:hypothetical protein
MSATNLVQPDCRFCSTVSKANGHDPIGSAWPYDQWLIVETPQPWESLWAKHPVLHLVYEQLIKPLWDQGVQVNSLAIAPDPDYSTPGHTRILHYRCPVGLFAQFQKQEFLVPTDHIYPLAAALLQQPDQLPQFEPYRQSTEQVRDLMVCTHGNVDVACARFGFPIYRQLRETYGGKWEGGRVGEWERGRVDETSTNANEIEKSNPPIHPPTHQPTYSPTHLPIHPSTHPPAYPPTSPPLRVWRCSHFGGHVFAPTLVDLPEGRYWGHLEPEMLDLLVYRNGSVADLRSFYRGWCGLKPFEQIAEREIWMQEGWPWLTYLKRGETIATAPTANEDDEADWAEVRIEYVSPDGRMTGAYTAKIEACGTVLTQWQSGQEHPQEPVKQYRVTQLERVEP